MNPLFDSAMQVGNPFLLFLERAFYGALGIFFLIAFGTAIKNGIIKEKNK